MPQKICSNKRCPHKITPQDYSEFYADKRSKDGLESRCKTCMRAKSQKYTKDNPKKARASHNRWRYERGGKERMNEYQNEWRRKNKTPTRRMRHAVSTSVRCVLKCHGTKKTNGGSTFKQLPYTPQQLKEHLENRFDDKMSWDNYGSYWNVDHIIPQAALPYDSLTHPNFQKCWALNNLRPLCKIENSSKGSFYEGKRHYYKKCP